MKQQEFELLKKSTEQKLSLTDKNVLEKSLSTPKTIQFYINIFTFEIEILKTLQSKKDKKYSELFVYYKENYKRQLDNKHEYETYIQSNDEYFQLCIEVNKQEIIVKYLEETIDNLKKLSFNIKNWLEIKKYFEGF